MRFRIFIALLTVFLNTNSYSQKTYKKADKVKLSENIRGEESYFYYNKDSFEIRHGRYFFNSELLKGTEGENIKLKKLVINGTYEHGKQDKQWVFAKRNAWVQINDLIWADGLSMDYALKGYENTMRMHFDKGIPQGKWEERRRLFEDRKYYPEKHYAHIHFTNGLATGEFYFEDSVKNTYVTIKGNLDKNGFFDNEVELSYKVDSDEVVEKRQYSKGFLLKIEVINKANDSLVHAIEYDDVTEKLNALNGKSENGSFRISEKGFGVTFDNGYQISDLKWSGQMKGNRYLFMLFHRFDSMMFLIDPDIKPVLNLTRRFQYIYPATDDSMLMVLKPLIRKRSKEYHEFLEKPKYILGKQKSDSLSYAYAFIKHASEKVNIIEEVIEKVDSGYFDFLFRPNYYKNGVSGLNRKDSIHYEYGDKKRMIPFDIGIRVKSPDDLLMQLYEYAESLDAKVREKRVFTDKRIQYYQEQEKINHLDTKIVTYSDKLDSLYHFKVEDIGKKMSEDVSFRYKLFNMLYNKVLKDLNMTYINETEYSKKVNIGNELVCFLETLDEKYSQLIEIEGMPKSIDIAFTRYQSNPFDTRQIENKVYINIERAGLKLFFHMWKV